MDRTLKMRAFAAEAAKAQQSNEHNLSLELAKRDALLEEEKKKSSEYQLMINQLRESLKLEQTRTAEMVKKKTEMENKVKELSSVDHGEMAKKNAEIDELQQKVVENVRVIMQLRESNKQEQARTAEMIRQKSELDAKLKEQSEVLAKIASLAASGRSA